MQEYTGSPCTGSTTGGVTGVAGGLVGVVGVVGAVGVVGVVGAVGVVGVVGAGASSPQAAMKGIAASISARQIILNITAFFFNLPLLFEIFHLVAKYALIYYLLLANNLSKKLAGTFFVDVLIALCYLYY